MVVTGINKDEGDSSVSLLALFMNDRTPTLADDGFLRFSRDDMTRYLDDQIGMNWTEAFAKLRASYNALETDEFMMEPGQILLDYHAISRSAPGIPGATLRK